MAGEYQFGESQAGFICLNRSLEVRFGEKYDNFSAVSSPSWVKTNRDWLSNRGKYEKKPLGERR
jgi:hypothetical protein